MASEERVEAWQASVTRCGLAARSLTAAVALYKSAGPDAQTAWEAVEGARRALAQAYKREGEMWKLASGEDAQSALPGMERPGPRGGRGRAKPSAKDKDGLAAVPAPEGAH